MVNKIGVREIEEVLGFELDEKVKKQIESFDLTYVELSKNERDETIRGIMKVLDNEIVYSGKHRLQEWESGWSENLNLFKKSNDISDLVPRYHSKYDIMRWRGDFVKSVSSNLDYKLHICLVDSILNKYIKDGDNVFEFGCGPGYHLLRFSSYKKVNLFGADWTKSSQSIISDINENFNLEIKPINFDFFNPDYTVEVPENSVFYTIAALEQVGDNFIEFINFIIEKNPKMVINMEPIDELLDSEKLVDYLSVKYFRKRNYLNKYLPYLEKLENEGKIEILTKNRINYGSLYVEGHSLIVWRPKK
jgi:hypothetical protein